MYNRLFFSFAFLWQKMRKIKHLRMFFSDCIDSYSCDFCDGPNTLLIKFHSKDIHLHLFAVCQQINPKADNSWMWEQGSLALLLSHLCGMRGLSRAI